MGQPQKIVGVQGRGLPTFGGAGAFPVAEVCHPGAGGGSFIRLSLSEKNLTGLNLNLSSVCIYHLGFIADPPPPFSV